MTELQKQAKEAAALLQKIACGDIVDMNSITAFGMSVREIEDLKLIKAIIDKNGGMPSKYAEWIKSANQELRIQIKHLLNSEMQKNGMTEQPFEEFEIVDFTLKKIQKALENILSDA